MVGRGVARGCQGWLVGSKHSLCGAVEHAGMPACVHARLLQHLVHAAAMPTHAPVTAPATPAPRRQLQRETAAARASAERARRELEELSSTRLPRTEAQHRQELSKARSEAGKLKEAAKEVEKLLAARDEEVSATHPVCARACVCARTCVRAHACTCHASGVGGSSKVMTHVKGGRGVDCRKR